MSLLREAERCFANQQTFKALNAFVIPANRVALLPQRMRDLQEADQRSIKGKSFYGTL